MVSIRRRHPDVVVVGTGRTGTSFVARILQEHFRISMAMQHRCEPWNPEGSFEDYGMIKYSYRLVEKPGYTVQRWLEQYTKYFSKVEGLVGIKQTALSLLSFDQWEELAPKLVIRTWRSDLLAVPSMVKWRENKDEAHWKRFYDKREASMMKHLDVGHSFPVGTVYFGSQRLEDWKMIQWLEYYLGRAGIKI